MGAPLSRSPSPPVSCSRGPGLGRGGGGAGRPGQLPPPRPPDQPCAKVSGAPRPTGPARGAGLSGAVGGAARSCWVPATPGPAGRSSARSHALSSSLLFRAASPRSSCRAPARGMRSPGAPPGDYPAARTPRQLRTGT